MEHFIMKKFNCLTQPELLLWVSTIGRTIVNTITKTGMQATKHDIKARMIGDVTAHKPVKPAHIVPPKL